MMKAYKHLFMVASFLTFEAQAQQLPMYQHAYIIGETYNPSRILNKDNETNIYFLRGNEFSRFEGGLINNYLHISTPLKDKKQGLGLEMLSRNYGFVNQFGVSIGYAYRAKFSEETNLQFGARLGILEQSFLKSAFNPFHQDDQTIESVPFGSILPQGNFGLTFNHKKLVAEFSIPQLLGNRINNVLMDDYTNVILKPHYFSRLSYKLKLNFSKLEIEPIVSVRYLPQTLTQAEVGFSFFYNENFWLNVNYRTLYSISFSAGMKIMEYFTLSYAIERPIVNLYNFYNNSHEVVLGFSFGKSRKTKVNENADAQNTNPPPEIRVVMDSIAKVDQLAAMRELLLHKVKERDSLLELRKDDDLINNYRLITVEVSFNMVDSIFESHLLNVHDDSDSINENKENSNQQIKIIGRGAETAKATKVLVEIEEKEDINLTFVPLGQPSRHKFVELNGEESQIGYYLISGVFTTLVRANTFFESSEMKQSKIIKNLDNGYYYVVNHFLTAESLKDIDKLLLEYRKTNHKIWVLEY